ncbi:MAG: Ig-like domain-containing protein [Ruminococcus sp.]|nr:Ig-like domain-containing protein [Ruminococcus sp.]
MKKCLSVLLVVVLLFCTLPILVHAETADEAESRAEIDISDSAVDDYPYHVDPGTEYYDEWGFVKGTCTSFCAWRLNKTNGVAFHNYYKDVHWGNGRNWGYAAQEVGIKVDKVPAVGSIAWWSPNDGHHVAWVAKVNNDGTVFIEEYNWATNAYPNGDYSYHTKTINASSPTGYIHIKDLSPSVSPVDLGAKFYANIVPTATNTKDMASSGAEDDLAESGGVTLLWPVEGHTTIRLHFHDHNNKAIDIGDADIDGATIRAAIGGTVRKKFTCTQQHPNSDHKPICYGYGTGVAIEGDDGRFYCYGHFQGGSIPSNVYEGARVNMGQVLGKVGTTGKSSGPHLHFEICKNFWPNSDFVNPENETYIYSMISPQDLGNKFYANIVPSGATSLAVTGTGNDNVKLYAMEYSDYQKWLFEKDGSAYKITNVKRNKCLDIKSGTIANGTDIQLYNSNGTDAQRWYIVKNGSGYYLLSKKNPDYAVDITGGTMSAGTNIQLYKKNNSTAQRFSINKIVTHTVSFNANGGTGSMPSETVTVGKSYSIPECAFKCDGYRFAGYNVQRKSDNKWYVNSTLEWQTAGNIQNNGYTKGIYSPGKTYTFGKAWTSVDNDTFTFYPIWKPNSTSLNFYLNYSGCNYILGGALDENYSTYIKSMDTSVYNVSVDNTQKLNGQSSLKIVGSSAGANKKHLRFETDTNKGRLATDSNGINSLSGDTKKMRLRFWAKSSVDGAKMYLRWGWLSTNKTITLSTSWKSYIIDMDKNQYSDHMIYSYFDKAGTFYINNLYLYDSDTSASTNVTPETQSVWQSLSYDIGSCYDNLPIPEREGYLFDGWYTAKVGGTEITSETPVFEYSTRVYAHWEKDVSYDPVSTSEYNGKTYELYNNAVSWETAKELCESKGGHLVTVSDKAENDFVLSMISSQNANCWLGLKRNADTKEFEWITDEPLTYTNWSMNEPGNEEMFASMYSFDYGLSVKAGEWNDLNGTSGSGSIYDQQKMIYICEYESVTPELIELDNYELNLEVDATKQLCATILPLNAEQTVTWSSDNNAVATVDENGIISTVGLGTAYISAMTSNGLMTRCEVTVSEPAVEALDIVLEDDWLYFEVGETRQLSATVYPEEADQTVIWSSDDEDIVTIDETGLLTAVSEGETFISIQSADGAVVLSKPVYVYPPYVEPEYVELNGFTGFINEDGTICIFDYEGNDSNIVIPSEINDIAVTEISGLYSKETIETVIIPASVKTIWSYAFDSCPNLEKVIIEGAESIGSGAFSRCPNLNEVNLPQTLKTINTNAFSDCPSLKSITIPSSVETIGECTLGYVFVPSEDDEHISYYETIENFTIYGYNYSAAQNYAENHGFSFISLDEYPTQGFPDLPTQPDEEYILGDVDGDGVVSVIDATAIQKVRASIPVNCFNETAADVDNDSVVSVIDATYIQKWLAHIDIPYDIGAQIV